MTGLRRNVKLFFSWNQHNGFRVSKPNVFSSVVHMHCSKGAFQNLTFRPNEHYTSATVWILQPHCLSSHLTYTLKSLCHPGTFPSLACLLSPITQGEDELTTCLCSEMKLQWERWDPDLGYNTTNKEKRKEWGRGGHLEPEIKNMNVPWHQS